MLLLPSKWLKKGTWTALRFGHLFCWIFASKTKWFTNYRAIFGAKIQEYENVDIFEAVWWQKQENSTLLRLVIHSFIWTLNIWFLKWFSNFSCFVYVFCNRIYPWYSKCVFISPINSILHTFKGSKYSHLQNCTSGKSWKKISRFGSFSRWP